MTRRRAREERAPATSPVTRPRRRRWRRTTTWVVAVGLVVSGVALGANWTLHQSYFRVQHVSVVGLRHERAAAVIAATGLTAHPSMFTISDAEIERRLGAFVWIRSVHVVKHWPNSVVISVRENVAVAVAFAAHHVLEYVDAQGRALGPAPLAANLPTLTYVNPTSNTWPFARAGRGAAYVASQLPRAFRAQVSVVTDDARGIVTLRLSTPVTFVLGPPQNLRAKFVAVASVIAHSTLVPGDVVDVSVPDELAVTPPG